jgi:diguanylate cyclase (GGDEF)-like protein
MRRYHPRHFEANWIVAEKRAISMDILACPLRLSDQSEVLQVIARDVSFRREAEARLQTLLRELQAANAKLEVLSTVDEMTGLHNFRHLKSQLELEHSRASRYGTPYAIVYCDIDHFKKYNDRNGHLAGDQLLREFALIVQSSIRTTDLAARYGGEEFCIICPGVNWEGAAVVAERIRSRVEAAPLPFREGQPDGKLTVSVGVASFPGDGKTSAEILKEADAALYASKEAGRNRVTIARALRKQNVEVA